jgi:hypothetical protein
MKVQIKVAPKVIVEAEGDNHVDLFEQLDGLQEVFSNHKCGKCGKEDIRFVVRTDAEENKYYELHCQNPKCRAKLVLGQKKKGKALYPKRKDDDKGSVTGNPNGYLPSNGWLKWNPEKKCNY